MKKLINKYLKLVAKIPEKHYWPIFIFFSLYFVVPYSEFAVTVLVILYFKFEQVFRNLFSKIVEPLPEWVRIGGSVIFFLVMLDDTVFYGSIILFALWTNREAKKLKSNVHNS